MSLQSQISDVVTRIATEFKTVKSKLSGNNSGDLSGLNTTDKTSLLAAINEVLTEVGTKEDALGFTPEDSANKGAANGYAPLDASAKVPAANLPAFVDDVVEYADFASLPASGEAGVIYITLADNKVYRWTGTQYTEISSSLALGETSSTAYRGDRGKTAYDHSQLTTGNPHAVTFAQLGSKPTTISGFGITDAYTKTEIGSVAQNFVNEFEAALV